MRHATTGRATFTRYNSTSPRLFRINPGVPCEQALEQASLIMGCVNQLTLLSATEEDPVVTWAAHCLGEMAKAIVDDVSLGLQQRA